MDANFVENLRKKLGWQKPKAPSQAGHNKAKFLRKYRKPSRRQAQEEGGGDLNDYFDFTSSSESETSFTNMPLSRMASNFNKKRRERRREMKRLANIKRAPDKHQTSTMTSSTSNSSKMKRPDHQTTMTTAASNTTHFSLTSFATTSSMLKPTPVGETKNKENSFTKPAVPAAPQPTTTSISNRTITMEKCIQTSPPQPSPQQQSSTPRPQKPPQPSTSSHKPLPQPELLMTSDEEEEKEPSINHQVELVLTEDEDECDGGDGSQNTDNENADFCEISIENTSNVFQNDKSYNRRSSDIYNKSERNSDDRPPSKVRRSLKYRTSSPSPNTSVQDQASGCHDDDAVAASHSEKRSTRKSHVSTKLRKSLLSRRSQASHRSSHESTHISRRSQTSYRSSQEKSQESTRSRESGKSFTKTPASTRRKTPGTSNKTPAATRKTPEPVTGTKTPAATRKTPQPVTGTKTPAATRKTPAPRTGTKIPVATRKTPAPVTGTKTPAAIIKTPVPVTGTKTPAATIKTPAPGTDRKTPAATIKTPAPGTDTKTPVAATTGKPSGRRLTRQSLKRASTEVKKQDSDIRSPRRKSRRRTFANLNDEEEVADIRLPRPSTARSQRQNTEIVVPPMEDVQDNGDNDVVMVEDDDVVLLPQTPKPTKTRGSGSSDNFVHIREWLNNPEPPETPDKMSDIVVQEVVDAGPSASINISIGGYNEPGRPQLKLSRQQLEGIIGMRTSSSEPNTSDNPSTSNQQPAPVMSNDIPSSPNIELPESPSVQIETVEEEVVVAEKSKISTRTTKNKSLAATNKSSLPIEIAGDEVVAEKSKLSTRTIKNKSLAAASKERSSIKKPPSTKKKAATKNKSSVEVADDEEVVVDKSKTSSIKENKSLAATNREKRANKKPPRQKKKTTTKNKETSDRFARDEDFQIDIISPDHVGIEAGLRRSKRYRTRPLGVPWKGRAVYAEDRTLVGFEVGHNGEIRYVNDERKKLDGSDSDDTIVQNITDNQALDPIVEEPAENELVAEVQTVQENDEIGQNKDDLVEDVQQIEDNLAEDAQQNEDIEQNEVDLVEDVGQNEVEDVGQDVDDDADIEQLSPTNNNTIEQLPQINTSPPKARIGRNVDFEYERDEDTDDFKNGFIKIKPKKQKPPATVKHWKTNFMVFNGEVELIFLELIFPSSRRSSKKTSLRKKELVQKKTKSVTLKAGCHFTVPPNSKYSLHNHQQQLARLAFVSVRDKDAQ